MPQATLAQIWMSPWLEAHEDVPSRHVASVALPVLLSLPVIAHAAVVVVEGRSSSRMIYARVAASLGEFVEVRTFRTAVEALKWLDTHSTDLVITAATLVDLEIAEFLRLLRRGLLNGSIPVVVITSNRDATLRERMLGAGATTVLHIPVPVKELQTRIRSLLQARQAYSSLNTRPRE